MDRALLRTLLNAGPSRCLDVLGRSRTIQARNPHGALLFQTPYLNRAILLKFVEFDDGKATEVFAADRGRSVRTLIYLPYDVAKPGDGGEAIVYAPEAFRRLDRQRTNRSDEGSDRMVADSAVLDLLDDVPAFNPFLLRDAFERAGLTLPDGYLALDPTVAERLRRRLRLRVRPLIVAALEGRSIPIADAVDRLVEAFVAPSSGADLEPLAMALRLDVAATPEILGAWAGIAYLEDELVRLTPGLRAFAAWLATCHRPREYLPADDLDELRQQLDLLRGVVRGAWERLRGVLDAYQATYRTLVFTGDPAPFVAFVRDGRRHYWEAGDLFGRFEQSVFAFEAYTRPYPHQPLPVRLLQDLLRFLLRTHVVQGTVVDAFDPERPPWPASARPGVALPS